MTLPTSGPQGGSVFWQGADGNIYTKSAASGWNVKREDTPRTSTPEGRQSLIDMYNNSDGGWTQIADPSGGGGGGDGDGGAGARANSQIASINSLLGLIGTKRDSGIGDLNASFAEQQRRLAEQKQAAMTGYDDQNNQNLKSRTRGYEQVDNFANNSANSLNRLFQGANAGVSSVARLLAPQLIGKAAGERRSGVTETANENESQITKARKNAEDEFGYTEQDLGNQRSAQERQFLESINNQEQDLLGKRLAYEQDAGLATDGTQNEINSRMAQLNALFGQFKPSYNMRATPTQAANLNSYSVDPAQLRIGQQQQGGDNFYTRQLKKKQQGLA